MSLYFLRLCFRLRGHICKTSYCGRIVENLYWFSDVKSEIVLKIQCCPDSLCCCLLTSVCFGTLINEIWTV